MQLADYSDQFEELGYGVATITYDSVELLKTVEEDEGIDFALLHDDEVRVVNAFGIRNLDYEPGHRAYGIPYPGILIINAEGLIMGKFAEEDYRERPALDAVLEAAKAALSSNERTD